MNQPTWKQRLYAVPVLGSLAAGVRGLFTLRIWRDAIRNDIASLQTRADESVVQIRGLSERLDGLHARLDSMLHQSQGQADSVACIQYEFNACSAELAHMRRDIRRVAAQAGFGRAVVPSPSNATGTEATSPPAFGPLAAARAGNAHTGVSGLADLVPVLADEAVAEQPFLHLLLPFRNEANARMLALHRNAPSAWLDILSAEAPGSVAAVAILAGAQCLDLPATQAVLDAAMVALRADGVLILQYDNPENLQVASRLLQAGPDCYPRGPALAQQLVRAAGFAHVDVMRLQADEQAPLAGDDPVVDCLNQLLRGPRLFAVVGRKAA